MKRTFLVAVAALLVATACDTITSQATVTPEGDVVHWQQNSPTLERQITVMVPASVASDGLFMRAVNVGIQQANRSPYVNMVLDVPQQLPTSCPTSHCISIQRKVMNGGSTGYGWGAEGHMYGWAVHIWIDSNPWQQAVLENALCHELAGHGLALRHSPYLETEGVQGPCQQARLTDWDLALINQAHEHGDAQVLVSAGVARSPWETVRLKPLPTKRVIHTTRAQYEAMTNAQFAQAG